MQSARANRPSNQQKHGAARSGRAEPLPVCVGGSHVSVDVSFHGRPVLDGHASENPVSSVKAVRRFTVLIADHLETPDRRRMVSNYRGPPVGERLGGLTDLARSCSPARLACVMDVVEGAWARSLDGCIRLGTGAAAHRFQGGTLRLTPLGASPASRQWQCTWSTWSAESVTSHPGPGS